MTNPTIGFVSLGCPKALVDTERILTRLQAEGYDISETYEDADLIVINTCAFIEEAVDESYDAIGEAIAQHGKVIVTGCLGKRARRLRTDFPELLAVTGPADLTGLMAAIHRHLPSAQAPQFDRLPPQGIRLTPPHFAYLKIAEGCSHRCRFCIIPQLRGPLVSRPLGDVMREAEALVDAGVRELLVVSQDTAAYGTDLSGSTAFWGSRPVGNRIVDLAEALGSLGVWVRLHYLYPYANLDRLVEQMAEGTILPYLDMPLQHASIPILRAMRRPAAMEDMVRRIERWREICPDLTIRSTFITGFPGETEADFQSLLDFLETVKLDRVGCFAYSPVEGAEANDLPGRIDPEIAEERRQRLMTTQERISRANLQRLVGQRIEVLVDEVDGGVAIARRKADAPDIDGIVTIQQAEGLQPGDLLEVTVSSADAHDCHVAGPSED